jgi:hypothetical protein
VELHWDTTPFYVNAAQTMSTKFKQLRRGHKAWGHNLSNLNRNIQNSNWVIALLDGLEDARPLSTPEKNFRKIIRNHLAKLLEAKRTYWKQRATIKFVRFDNENTKVFHAMSTYTNGKNHVCQLFLDNGDCLTQHGEKAAALWESYKGRLGTSEFDHIYYDLNYLIPSILCLYLIIILLKIKFRVL